MRRIIAVLALCLVMCVVAVADCAPEDLQCQCLAGQMGVPVQDCHFGASTNNQQPGSIGREIAAGVVGGILSWLRV